MKVKELLEYLSSQDPEASVILATQPGWPFECSIAGVCSRRDFCDERDSERAEYDTRRESDVVLAEGKQLRYGHRDVWTVAK